jgi:hypothetical protein
VTPPRDDPGSAGDIAQLERYLDGSVTLPLSIDAHVRRRQLDLAASLAGRVAIYLDTRFWIDLRRADEDGGSSSRARPLLAALRVAVGSGRAFCPISASTFIELLKHSDADVRRRTAALVDELSLGVSILALDELLDAEVRWFADDPGDSPLDPVREPVWTKLAYALGTISPEIEGMGARELLAFQVVGFDAIWRTTLEEVVVGLGEPTSPNFDEAAERMTRDSAAHVHEIPTFDAAYRAELSPMATMGGRFLARHLREKATAAGVVTPDRDDGSLEICRNVIGNALVLDKGRQSLRSAHIRASLHAIIRHNRARRFRANDIFDIEHAVGGIGYGRAFFTEKSMCAAATQPPLSLDRLYDCFVTSDVEAATRFVMNLG